MRLFFYFYKNDWEKCCQRCSLLFGALNVFQECFGRFNDWKNLIFSRKKKGKKKVTCFCWGSIMLKALLVMCCIEQIRFCTFDKDGYFCWFCYNFICPINIHLFTEDCEALSEFKPDIYEIILGKIQFQKRN